MKKTVTINISGIIFHIDEDAFEMLSSYLDRVKRHFSKSEGREEIVGDIESRIAEILQEKLTDYKQVISIEDIREVTGLMGEPDEFGGEEEQQETVKKSRRLYRDPDNKMIAGVSSGLGWYFDIDPVWFRGLFIVTLFFSGAGVIAYLIMWLVVPEARGTAEKLEMRGEPVNLSSIEASISHEFKELKGKLNELADEAKHTFNNQGTRTFLEKTVSMVGVLARGVIKVVLVVVGLVFTLFSFITIVSLLAAISGLSSFSFFEHGELMGFSLPLFLQMVFSNQLMIVLAEVSAVLLVFVPLLLVFYLGLRLLIGKRVKISYIGRTAAGLWLAGLILGIVVAVGTSFDFRHTGIKVVSEVRLPVAPQDTIFLDATSGEKIKDGSFIEVFGKNVQMVTDSYQIYDRPQIGFKNSNGYFMHVTARAFAKGKTAELAYKRAEVVDYNLSSSGGILVFDDYYTLPENSLIRDQMVRVRIEIPDGQLVHLSENMRKLLDSDWWFYHNFNDFRGSLWQMMDGNLLPLKKEEAKEAAEIKTP